MSWLRHLLCYFYFSASKHLGSQGFGWKSLAHTHTPHFLPPSHFACTATRRHHLHALQRLMPAAPRCWGWAPLGGVGSRWGGLLMPSQGTCCNPASTVFPFLSECYPRVSVGRGFGVLKAMDVSRSLGLKISREAT